MFVFLQNSSFSGSFLRVGLYASIYSTFASKDFLLLSKYDEKNNSAIDVDPRMKKALETG